MDFQLSEIPSLAIGYGLAGIIVAAFLISTSRRSNFDAIPTVGSSSWLGSLWAGLKYRTNAAKVIQEGYEKHKSSPFKVAALYQWIVVVRSREHIEELLRVSEDDLSSLEASNDRFHTQLILPREVSENRYHLVVLRSQLTRSIGMMCPAMREEIVTAFDEVLDLKGSEWQSVPALGAVQKVVCRTSNRMFVGLSLCRDPDWIELNIKFTVDFVKTGAKLGLFPGFIRPLVAGFFTEIDRSIARGIKHLRPIIEERLERLREYGKDGAEMPSDLLSWLMEEADVPFTVESLTTRILGINMAAINTTSNSLTHALFYLAANTQYIQPLREEVETIIEKEGWTKVALVRMSKVDSFLKECQRMAGTAFVNLTRKAMRDYTFADGTLIPRGTTVGIGAHAVHFDDRLYENAQVFKPFRFVDTDKVDGEGAKHRFVSTGIDYLSFGHGKHACPGRFFATNELKCLMAHVVVTYDVKLEGDGTIPRSRYVGATGTPDPHARVLFRKRID